MAVNGTIQDSEGNTWQWVSQGSDRYGLVRVQNGGSSGIVGPTPTVRWQGDRWYPGQLTVGGDGRVISGMSPGSDWGV